MSMEYYLQKLIEKCNEFDIDEIPAAAGLEFDEELTLDQIYVDYTTLLRKTWKQQNQLRILRDRLPLREDEVPVVMLTAPAGGGKTVLLKRCAIALVEDNRLRASTAPEVYSNLRLSAMPTVLEEIFHNREARGMYLPVWISPEEMEDSEDINLQEILQAAMAKIVSRMILPEEGSWTYVMLVDGIEKFRNTEIRDRFFYLLTEFYKEHRDAVFIMSMTDRSEEYAKFCWDMLSDVRVRPWKESLVFTGIEIPEVYGDPVDAEEIVKLFAYNWLQILNPHDVRSTKMTEDAEKIAKKLLMAGLDDFLNTPFEITNWLLLYLRDNFLPESESEITARELNLLLERKRSDRYHILDVKRHLARIAFAASMTAVTWPDIMTAGVDFEALYLREHMEWDNLRDIIYRTDCELGRYFEFHQDTSAEAMDDLIEYLVSTGILCRPGGRFNFSNHRYQAYLTVFCMTQNLFTKEESHKPETCIANYSMTKIWTGSSELWRHIILSLAEQNVGLRDRMIQTVLNAARARAWDMFPLDCLLDLLARYGMAVTEEEYLEICVMLCFRSETEDDFHKQDAEDRRKLLTEKQREIFSIIDHNSRERNEYLWNGIVGGYAGCVSEEERQQFLEYAEAVSEFLKNTLELQESEEVMGMHQEKWEKIEKALESDGTEFTVCGYLYKILKEDCTKEERQLFLQQLIELDLIQTREKEYTPFNEKDLEDLTCWSIGFKVEQKMQQLKKTNPPENFYAALEEFLFENSEFDSERAQSIALYLCLTAKEPAPEDMEEMKKLAEEFGL